MKKKILMSLCAVCFIAQAILFAGCKNDPPENPADNQVYFYGNLSQALEVVTNSDYANASLQVDENSAGVSVNVASDAVTINVLKNLEVAKTLTIQKDLTIDLNGKEIVGSCDVLFKVQSGNVIFKGTTEGSKVSLSNDGGQVTLLHVLAGTCKIDGGSYKTTSNGVATTANPNVSILCAGGRLDIENASIDATDSDSGVLYGVKYNNGTNGNIKNSFINVDAPNGLNSYSINNEGTLLITNSTINAYSNYKANEAKTDYACSSRGVFSTGSLTLKNCNVYGVHSGITSRGDLYIDGGTYEGYGHGGLYIGAEGKTSYLKNATFKDSVMKNDYIDDGVAGTNKSGAYVGGASNVTVYIDNCNFSGAYYPFVLRSSGYMVDGVKHYESNVNVYISNSTIDFDRDSFKYIRVDASASANQKLYIGVGNNFTVSDGVYKEGNAEATDVNYASMFPTI